ncbi:C6 transcription factor [Colletotrichum plurivorum]|uniref:C6 transcription factor n=1 Tax=Colletotrichum plurivorum TaxID=2175906 RepID=A0A8H6N5P0_9PEZI|nr:C6 transcription factor [Colletotrichum plurivorum]
MMESTHTPVKSRGANSCNLHWTNLSLESLPRLAISSDSPLETTAPGIYANPSSSDGRPGGEGHEEATPPKLPSGLQSMPKSAYNAQAAGNTEKELSLEARERRLEDQTRLLELLRSLPGPEAVQLLQRFRSTSDTSRVLSSLEGSFHGETRPSDLDTARAILPLTKSSIEFELMAQYGTAYPRLFPTSPAEFATVLPPEMDFLSSGLQDGPEIHLESTQREVLEGPSETDSQSDQGASQLEVSDPSRNRQQARVEGPRSPPRYCDSRLERPEIRYWTKVPISNELAATLIPFYLENDHPIMGFFDADLFLDDLAACRQEFCSAFLVVSVLCLASQEYTIVKPQVSAFRPAFLQEAEMLWRGEASNDSILSVAAIEIFSAASKFQGNDTLGTELSMAERLELVGSVDGAAAAALAQKSPEWARATSHIAWGAYGWLTRTFFPRHYLYPKLDIQQSLQTMDNSRRDNERLPRGGWARLVGPRAVGLCGGQVSETPGMGRVSDSEMKRSILAPANLVVFHASAEWSSQLKTGFGPADMQDSVWFHVLATILFRPFTSTPETDCLMSFASTDSHSKQIYAASVNQLRDIILTHWTSCSGSFFTPFMNSGLFTLSLALLEDRGDPQWRSYFLLCIRCCRDLYASYPVFRNIVQAFLSMAMQKDALTAHESKEIMEWVEDNGCHNAKGIESFTTFIFDPTSAAASESQINAMALKFDEMILLDEFTTGTDA